MNLSKLLQPSWLMQLQSEFEDAYMKALIHFLQDERATQTIYPPEDEVFTAFNETAFDKVKVVVIGQDPYHGPAQAHGLSFSVRPPTPPPPSLKNIFKEYSQDLNLPMPSTGDLSLWAQQGVFLLNSVLTVRQAQAHSHAGKGWEKFTDKTIALLSEKRENLCFILWGVAAQKKGAIINRQKHLLIESPHPSPLSAHRGFFGTKPFSRTNQYLHEQGQEPIDWTLP